MEVMVKTTDGRRAKLDDVYKELELIRPNQFKKIPKSDHELYEEVWFDWGTNQVRGFRKIA